MGGVPRSCAHPVAGKRVGGHAVDSCVDSRGLKGLESAHGEEKRRGKGEECDPCVVHFAAMFD